MAVFRVRQVPPIERPVAWVHLASDVQSVRYLAGSASVRDLQIFSPVDSRERHLLAVWRPHGIPAAALGGHPATSPTSEIDTPEVSFSPRP